LDAFHLDIDHQDGFRVFTVDKNRFSGLKQLAEDFARQGTRLISILDPGVKNEENFPVYQQGRARDVFCSLPNNVELQARVWPGWCAFPDFTSAAVRKWWAEQYRSLLDLGIQGFWQDMNEPAVLVTWGDPSLPLSTEHHMEGRKGNHLEAHNLYALLMARSGYEALKEQVPEQRPWLLTRSGWAGVQRYAWTWTGDCETSWPALRQTVPTVLGLGLSGIAFSGPDIGGFSGTPSAELYIRWFQLAAFLPFFRCHCSRNSQPREPWVFAKPYLDIVRCFLQLRKRLLPFWYTLAWQASNKGYPLARPLFWSFGQELLVQDVEDVFMLGEELLIAPILDEESRQREIPLPQGLWYDFWEDQVFEGGQVISHESGLERIPVLVRSGSIIPMQAEDSLTLHVYLPEQEGQGVIYSDSGQGYAQSRLDLFSMKRSKQALELRWESEGEFAWPYAHIFLHLHGAKPTKAWIDGLEYDWEEEQLSLSSFERMLIVLK
jgi:alpha-glucosidase